VTRFKPGDAVFASIFDLGTGALAEFAVVPENAAALKPANLDFVQAASIPMVGLTSWQALKERAKLEPGQQYSFLFVHPDGGQLAEIGKLLEAGRIRPVIDKVFPFDQAKEALAYLEKGRAKGKVVVQMK